MFEDISNDLSHYINELQLGVLFDVKQCQEEDQADRRQDMNDLRVAMATLTNNNQAMMDVMLSSMQEMMAQMMNRVDQAILHSPTASVTSSLGMTDAELESIEGKIEAISTSSSLNSTASSSKKTHISLDDLQMIDHRDVQYFTDSTKGSFIGGGTFGDVYKGTFKGQPVAIKVLKDNTAMAMSALKKEAYAMQLLSACKYMIRFYGARIDNKPYYLVMELACCSLYDILYDEDCSYKLAKGNLQFEAAASLLLRKLKILYDIVQGIYFLHSVKVIHRDIKPMNVMLTTTGGLGAVGEPIMKLSDFGSAKMKDVGASTNGLAKGTPAYMAPEIILADDPDSIEYSEASDVYAFGVLMNEVLEHCKPFDGMKAIQIIRALDKGSRPKLFKAEEDLTATGDGFVFELQVLIDRCWHETTTKRPVALSILKKLSRLGGFKPTATIPSTHTMSSFSEPSSPIKLGAAVASSPSQNLSNKAPAIAQLQNNVTSASTSVPATVVQGNVITPLKNISVNDSSVKSPPPPLKNVKPVVTSTALPPTPPKPVQAPTGNVLDSTTKEITDLLNYYSEAFRYYTEVRIECKFDKIVTMKRLALAKTSKQSCFLAGYLLLCLSISDVKPHLELTGNQIWSLGVFVHDEMQTILSTIYLKQHPQLSNYANFFLGLVIELGYHSSDCSSKNPIKAFPYMKAAAEGGFPPAQSSLGIMYDRGSGVTKNAVEAFTWFRRGADANYVPAIHNAGHCLEEGQGCTKNLSEAFRYYQRAAEHGYVSSMVNLSLMYRNGTSVTKNEQKAFELMHQAALKECIIAQRHVGLSYEKGIGARKNVAEAIRWYQKSANYGDTGAKLYLAICYDLGIGVPKNTKKARELEKEAADAGDEEAKFVVKEFELYEKAYHLFKRIRFQLEYNDFDSLAALYRSEGNIYAAGFQLFLIAFSDSVVKRKLGIVTPQSDARNILADGMKHFEERSEFDHPRISAYAYYFLGVIYENGFGDAQMDTKKALQYYTTAAEKDYDVALNTVGICTCKGIGRTESDAESISWFQRAADLGFYPAYHNIGNSYQYGMGVPINYTKALECYQAAADQGHVGSILNLGVMYDEAIGVPKNLTKAISLYRIAADKGNSDAQYNLGLCYEKGTGVPKDKAQAKHYYQLAAAQDHADAKSRLEKCIIS